MKGSVGKSKLTKCSRGGSTEIVLSSETLKQKAKFYYLGIAAGSMDTSESSDGRGREGYVRLLK